MAQTAYKYRYDRYLVGQVQIGGVVEKNSGVAEEAINFGVCVKRGTTVGGFKNIAVNGTSDVVYGVAVHRHNELGLYSAGDDMTILSKGEIAVNVLATDSPTAGANAYMIVDNTANFGKWTITAGSNTVTCGKFQVAKDSNNIATVKFDIVA